MACLLSGVIYCKGAATTPDVLQFTYMNDRTAVIGSLQSLLAFQAEWAMFEGFGRLRANPVKTQYWARNEHAAQQFRQAGISFKPTIHILGTTLGPLADRPSPEEQERLDDLVAMCQKIAALPVRPPQENSHAPHGLLQAGMGCFHESTVSYKERRKQILHGLRCGL